GRTQESTRAFLESGNVTVCKRLQVSLQIGEIRERPHVNETLRWDVIFDVGGTPVNGNSSRKKAIEDLLGNPSSQDGVLKANGEFIVAEGLRLRIRDPPVDALRRYDLRVRKQPLPIALKCPFHSLQRRWHGHF